MNILLVGGTFDNAGGKSSGVVNKIYAIMEKLVKNDSTLLVNMYNGGHFFDVERILGETRGYDIVFWMPNIPNNCPKIRNVKEVSPFTLLVSSKRNDDKKYSFQELINHSLCIKANLTIEFVKEKELFHLMAYDPLGTVWFEGTNLEECVVSVINRLKFLKSITRQQTTKSEDSDLIMAWYFNGYKQDEYQSDENPDIPEQSLFFELIKKYAKVFHKIMMAEKGVNRFLGNASFRPNSNFRCTKGFPSFRAGKYIFVSERNANKEFISQENFVATYLEDNKVYYCGDKKPSVDTPIQLRLYGMFPEMNYMIHSHCYLEGAPFTKIPIPCGALEEVDEILAIINKMDPDHKNSIYEINLIGHGSIAVAAKIEQLENLKYYGRDLPERI